MLKRRILVVDDNVDIHNDFKKILSPKTHANEAKLSSLESELFGGGGNAQATEEVSTYELDLASQGQQALEMCEKAAADNDPYALIFMDVRMPPGWDGIETTRRIWQKFPYTEIVLCTAYTDYSIEDMVRILGVNHRLLLIKKPFDAVSIKQMALAITSKWKFEEESRNQMNVLEQKVQERTRELQEATGKFVQSGKMAALGEMAGGMAHEINNPLTIIQNHASLLKDLVTETPLDMARITKGANTIESTVGRIAKIISGLRSFSRDSGEDPFEQCTVKQIVDDTATFCSERFRHKEVKLLIDPIPDALTIECRPTQISQVLLNLLNNAFDAVCEEKGAWVKVTVRDLGQQAEIAVIDSGGGISQKVADKLFQPFFTTKPIGKGVGIGLSISKGIADEHGGTIGVDMASKNTKFVMTLPKKQKVAKKAA